MIILTKILTKPLTKTQLQSVKDRTTLDIDSRIKSRIKIVLNSGQQAGVILPRGLLIRGGDYLATEDESIIIEVLAANENVSTAYCNDKLLLARACYHLGNRHVPLQIATDFVRYQHDHVLDEMLTQLGIKVRIEQAPFEPEAGAYQSSAIGHHHHH